MWERLELTGNTGNALNYFQLGNPETSMSYNAMLLELKKKVSFKFDS